MRTLATAICLVALVGVAGAAYAELQNIEIGGEIRIRGRYWNNGASGVPTEGISPWPGAMLRRRVLGHWGITSRFDWDNAGSDVSYIEQRTALHVKADFTDNVSVFIELSNYGRWGEDFRSPDYVTGTDQRATIDKNLAEVEIYQGYIETDEMFGFPVRLRVGRQELVFGKGWLVGNMISPTLKLSFDAIRLTYTREGWFEADAFASKLVENYFGDEDVELAGIYATLTKFEPVQVSGYWFWLRDPRNIDESPGTGTWRDLLRDRAEKAAGVNDYGTTHLHTLGGRIFGEYAGFDYDGEIAYQLGPAGQAGALFTTVGYGDDDARFKSWATDIEIGYTIDVKTQPRFSVGCAHFEGDDNRDMSFTDWLNPNYMGEASLSFNRLFSAKWYSAIFDIPGGSAANLSNFTQARAGFKLSPLECLSTGVKAAYFWVDEVFNKPAVWKIGRGNFPISALFPWMTEASDKDFGLTTTVWAKYNYTEDLFVSIGWEHFFPGGALNDGAYVMANGLRNAGGSATDDADYLWIDTGIKF